MKVNKWSLSKKKFTYILRYYLPCLPQYTKEVTESRLNNLVDFCKKNYVEAVMFYVDLNPYWYYMPDDLEHTEYMIGVVSEAAQTLRNHGISYQLNYQNLFGSWDGNTEHRGMYNWGCYVDEFGEESMGCACMIDKDFRILAGKKLAMWSATKPDVIWIDDDFRVHNHRTEIHHVWEGEKSSEELDFGCFCDNHINTFNEKYNLAINRNLLRMELLKSGKTSDIANKWRLFINECYTNTSSWIEETIHSVSVNTRIALMTSVPDVHAVEGRNWYTMLTALTGEDVPLIRSHYGPYVETDPREFVKAYLLSEQLCSNIAAQYNNVVNYCPEIENTRFTIYSKSVSATAFQIMLSAFQGYGGVTLSLYDLEGCVLSEEPEFGVLLSGKKKFCDELTKLNQQEYKPTGIALVTSPDRFLLTEKRWEANRISDLVQKRKMDAILAKTGVACVYSSPETLKNHKAVALDEDSVKQLTDDELICCLSKGVFLNSGGANEICKRGLGKYIGISVGEKVMTIASSEQLVNIKHSDGSCVYVPSRIAGGGWRQLLLEGAEVYSYLVSPDGIRRPGFTFYENELGGRVCVYAADNDFGDGFFSNYRIKMIRSIMKKLSKANVVADLNGYGLCAARKNENSIMVFVANLSADIQQDISLDLPRYPQRAYVIDECGRKTEIKVTGNKIVIPGEIGIYGALVVVADF